MKTLINILAHKDAQATFERHFEFWHRNADSENDIIVWCPSDQKVNCPGIQVLGLGKAQHHGAEANTRIYSILEHCMGLSQYDRMAFFEYDSICLLPKIPDYESIFCGNIFSDIRGYESGEWPGMWFVHPPFIVKTEAIDTILSQWRKLGIGCSRGFWDRAIGQVIGSLPNPIALRGFMESQEGFSANTIQPAQFGDLHKAVLNGAHMIHGIKTQACLNVIRDAIKELECILHLKAKNYTVVRE